MARHAQPRELAELKGAGRAHPERYKDEPPKSPLGLGQPPAHMSEAAKAIWFELDTYSLPGVLTGADRFVLEVTCTLFAEYRRDPDAFPIGKYAPLNGNLARLGLSPADRQKLGVSKPEKSNPFDDF